MARHDPHRHVPITITDNNAHGAKMGPIWGRQESGGTHVGPMNFDIWDATMDDVSGQFPAELRIFN